MEIILSETENAKWYMHRIRFLPIFENSNMWMKIREEHEVTLNTSGRSNFESRKMIRTRYVVRFEWELNRITSSTYWHTTLSATSSYCVTNRTETLGCNPVAVITCIFLSRISENFQRILMTLMIYIRARMHQAIFLRRMCVLCGRHRDRINFP